MKDKMIEKFIQDQPLRLEKLILARVGEIALKGLNRKSFEKRVIQNLAKKLRALGNFEIFQTQARLFIRATGSKDHEACSEDLDLALQAAQDTFGIVSASPIYKFRGDLEVMKKMAIELVQEKILKGAKTFKVETRRGNKNFPLISPQISAEIGGAVLDAYPELSVNVKTPDFIIYLEVHGSNYIFTDIHQGVKGLPVGSSSKSMLLLSGGIDSPVAGYMLASRGAQIEAIYFHTFPYTSDRAKQKVIDLAQILSRYTGDLILHIVDFTDIQLELNQFAPQDMMTIVMRRMMMRIAEAVAQKRECKSLLTGESLGQVASQTMEGLACTNAVCTIPVFRPLIGLDKDDTCALARRIGSFETSILPYEDCCTVFVAKHPKTRPTIDAAIQAEEGLDIERLVNEGINKVSSIYLNPRVQKELGNILQDSDFDLEKQ